jgi:hypothetical protein
MACLPIKRLGVVAYLRHAACLTDAHLGLDGDNVQVEAMNAMQFAKESLGTERIPPNDFVEITRFSSARGLRI